VNLPIKIDPYRLHIFHEGRKRRIFVAELIYVAEKDHYELIYDKKYANSKSAIPIGPDLDLIKLRHASKKGRLFQSLNDRIPDKSNPAYTDYCNAKGISLEEKNPIILLGTIGHRGPSSFIFELVYTAKFTTADIKELREKLQITQHDLAEALDISKQALQKIESGASQDLNTLKRIEILLTFSEVALWQLKKTGGRVHYAVLNKLMRYFESLKNEA
jgi:DNA-binding XRE family transcriptional regulator